MQKTFDIGLDSLVAGASAAAPEPEFISTAPQRGTFYLETFGCQMNDHDSEKVAGVLLSRGYRQGDSIGAASFVFFNICSIRGKHFCAAFSRMMQLLYKTNDPADMVSTCRLPRDRRSSRPF